MADPPFETYASRFGISKEHFPGGGSAFTPVIYTTPPTEDEFKQGLIKELYQAGTLRGFVTSRLLANECFYMNERPSAMPDIQFVHPVFERSKWKDSPWKSTPPHPLPNEHEGFWSACNEKVWEVMQPVFRLASQFLEHSGGVYWWQALIEGRRTLITAPEAPAGYSKLERFFRVQPDQITKELEMRVKDSFEDVLGKLEWSLISSYTDVWGHKGTETHGMMWFRPHGNRADIYLAFENFAPLLKDSPANDDQRLMQEHFCAAIILHEIAHAIHGIIFDDRTNNEPYFETEYFREVGHSMENALFGGQFVSANENSQSWRDDIENNPLAIILCKHTPGDFADPLLTTSPMDAIECSLPISVKYFADLRQQDFWDHAVRKYGVGATRPPWTFELAGKEELQKGYTGHLILKKEPFVLYDESHEHTRAYEQMLDRDRRTEILRCALTSQFEQGYRLATGGIQAVLNSGWSFVPKLRKWPHTAQDEWVSGLTRDLDDESSRLLEFIKAERHHLAIESMTTWTPLNAFRNYIHQCYIDKYPIHQGPLPRFCIKEEPLRYLLQWCRKSEQFFDFSLQGAGLVRIISHTWRAHYPFQNLATNRGAARTTTQIQYQSEIEAALDEYGPSHIWPNTKMKDVDMDRVLESLCEIEGELDGPFHPDNYWDQREGNCPTPADIKSGLEYIMDNQCGRIVRGPPGIVRRVGIGWPEGLFGPDVEAPWPLPEWPDDV